MFPIKRHVVKYPAPATFPDLPTKQARCVGQMHYLSDKERDKLDVHTVVIVRDTLNPVDSDNALAVLRHDGRKLGYLSSAQAKAYAPTIESLGALEVPCRVEGSRLWIDLPTLPAIKKAVALTA